MGLLNPILFKFPNPIYTKFGHWRAQGMKEISKGAKYLNALNTYLISSVGVNSQLMTITYLGKNTNLIRVRVAWVTRCEPGPLMTNMLRSHHGISLFPLWLLSAANTPFSQLIFSYQLVWSSTKLDFRKLAISLTVGHFSNHPQSRLEI